VLTCKGFRVNITTNQSYFLFYGTHMLSRNNSVVAIDIGSSCIKLVQLKRNGNGQWSLGAADKASLPPEAIVDGSIYNSTLVIDTIKDLLTKNRIKSKNVVAAVSGNGVIIKPITVSKMPADDLDELIKFEAEQYIPFDLSEVNIDVEILEDANPDPGNMDVLLVAARKEIVNEQLNILQQAKLKLVVMDVGIFALANTFAVNYEDYHSQTVALVNVGASSTSIIILNDGNCLFTREISGSGGDDDEEVDAVIPQETQDILQGVSEGLAVNIQKSLDFFVSNSAGANIDQIYVSGGAAQTAGLVRAIEEQTGIPSSLLDPLQNIEVSERDFKEDYLVHTAPQYAIAIGLAMRSASQLKRTVPLIAISLLPQKTSRRFEQVQNEFNLFAVILVIFCFVLGGIQYYVGDQESTLQVKQAKLQNDINRLEKEVKLVTESGERKKVLEKRLSAIELLRKGKVGPVRMMEELVDRTPPKVQLKELSETNGRIKLTGVASNNADISKFLKGLEESRYFNDVYLNTIEQVDIDGFKLKSFSISARMKVPSSKNEKAEDKQ
jgi:type IV pilus assembly protein PilM